MGKTWKHAATVQAIARAQHTNLLKIVHVLLLFGQCVVEEAFYTTFDMVTKEDVSLSELDIEQGLAEWREKDSTPRKYQVGCIKNSKVLLADFTTIESKQINKLLLDDLCKIVEKSQAEDLYIALSALDPKIGAVVRNLVVYGFEKVGKEEAAKHISNPEIMVMKMEVNQEDDFVDLY